mgnify:CR=1 FL=1|jgi:hypothetical protein
MEGAVTCSNCGASNDPIVSNCQFCGGHLESDVDPRELPEATLLNNASEWLGRLEAVATSLHAHNAATNRENPLESYLSGDDQYSLTQIKSNAQKYINILSAVSSNNPALQERISHLQRRHKNLIEESREMSNYKKEKNKVDRYCFCLWINSVHINSFFNSVY